MYTMYNVCSVSCIRFELLKILAVYRCVMLFNNVLKIKHFILYILQ